MAGLSVFTLFFTLFSLLNGVQAKAVPLDILSSFEQQPGPDKIRVYSFERPGKSEWQLTPGWQLFKPESGKTVLNFDDNINYGLKIEQSALLKNINLARPDFLDAELLFNVKADLLSPGTFLQLEYSVNKHSWVPLKRIFYLATKEHQEKIPLDMACGYPDVTLRLTLQNSDSSQVLPKIEIGEFLITAFSVDNTAPLIIHTPKPAFAASSGENEISARISDLSGIKSATLSYRVNGGKTEEITPLTVKGDLYRFSIPEQESGSLLEYYITATDNSANANSTKLSDLRYLAGYQPPGWFDSPEMKLNNLLCDASASSGVKKLAIPYKLTKQNLKKTPDYLLLRSFAAGDPQETEIILKFLKAVQQDGRSIPSEALSEQVVLDMSDGNVSDPYGYQLIDLKNLKISPDKQNDSLIFLELTALKGKTGLVYLSGKKKVIESCFVSENADFSIWQDAGFTDSSGTEVYPHFPADLIFAKPPESKDYTELVQSLNLNNFSNMVNNITTIRFELRKRSLVSLSVYDILGRETANLINGQLKEGVHSVGLDAANYSSGIYYYVLKVDDKLIRKKMVVAK